MLYKWFLAIFICLCFVFPHSVFAKTNLLYRSDVWTSSVNDQTHQYRLDGVDNGLRFSLVLTPKQPAILQVVLSDNRLGAQPTAKLIIDQTAFPLSKEVLGYNKNIIIYQYAFNSNELINFIHEITSRKEAYFQMNSAAIPISLVGGSSAVSAILDHISDNQVLFLPSPFNYDGKVASRSAVELVQKEISNGINSFWDNLFSASPLQYVIYAVIIFLFYKVIFKFFIVRLYRYFQRRKAKKLCFKEIQEQAQKLQIRRQQLLYRDEYGSIVFDKWNKEMTKFIQSRIRPLLSYYRLEHYYPDISKSVQKYIAKIAKQTPKRKKTSENRYHPQMDAYDYEKFCAQKLCEVGWKARATKGSGDQGADVVALKDGVMVVIQCKLYSKAVGNDAVQQVNAAKIYYGAQYAAVVSNASYTVSAKQLASSTDIALLHHDEIQDYARYILAGK